MLPEGTVQITIKHDPILRLNHHNMTYLIEEKGWKKWGNCHNARTGNDTIQCYRKKNRYIWLTKELVLYSGKVDYNALIYTLCTQSELNNILN